MLVLDQIRNQLGAAWVVLVPWIANPSLIHNLLLSIRCNAQEGSRVNFLIQETPLPRFQRSLCIR